MSIVSNMIGSHQCGIDSKPRWMIYGWMKSESSSSSSQSFGVQYWIKPSDSDEFIARKIAQLLNEDKDNNVIAEKTEWHPQMGDRLPINQKPSHLNNMFG